MAFVFHSVNIVLFIFQLLSLVDGKCLWSSRPATNYTALLQHAYAIGNGRLAVLPYGEPGCEKLSLNRDSLWNGGPFANTSYRGGNPGRERHQFLSGIRNWIWQNGTGSATRLMGDDRDYGSYQVLGNLSVAIDSLKDIREYKRSLDLKTGVHGTTFRCGAASYAVKTFCSHPDDVCVYALSSSHALPSIRVSIEQLQQNASLITTSRNNKDQVRLTGTTRVDPSFSKDIGIKYEFVAKVVGRRLHHTCQGTSLHIPQGRHREVALVLAAGTNYDESHGTPRYQYSFRGPDPGPYVQSAVDAASAKSELDLLSAHITDYAALANAFTLNLPDTANSAGVETAKLITRYANPNTTASGDPYLENLVFDYGRHLYISSGRSHNLPPNLKGKWANVLENAWGADYQADINLQMNHWHVDQTGLGALQASLWDYMAEAWAPRGAETAQLLYNAPGWVAHDEVNIFGYSAMKTGDDYWADYPASAAWMMQHVWDYFDYSQDMDWLKRQGYLKLFKPVAQLWLSQLQSDKYFRDGTLVVNPCDSPEHGPTTFGCTHWQQLIFQVFETTLKSASLVGEVDQAFLSEIREKLAKLDKGLHIGSWGRIQEWKLDIDVENDTHRHLPNLVGWYPGWSLSSYLDGYTNAPIRNAVETTLYSRGVGIGPDANSGWEKVWRAACWARLNNSMKAYYELRMTIFENWAPNALSMYSGHELPFQSDANFGFSGAVLSMLVVDLPQLNGDDSIPTVVLGPAIPPAWGDGSVSGLRLRGGGSVDFRWDMEGVVIKAKLSGRVKPIKIVNKHGMVLAR